VFFSHQVGAALAAYLGGVARDSLGDYTVAFLAAGRLAIVAALMASRINREPLSPVQAGVTGPRP
jgi:predicted MFS family arabinose efflux permease